MVILISKPTYERVKDLVEPRRGSAGSQGKSQPIEVFEILA